MFRLMESLYQAVNNEVESPMMHSKRALCVRGHGLTFRGFPLIDIRQSFHPCFEGVAGLGMPFITPLHLRVSLGFALTRLLCINGLFASLFVPGEDSLCVETR